MDDWTDITTVAARLDISRQSAINAARGYTDGASASHPIERREAPTEAGGQRHYVYRIDDEARWRGDEVRRLREESGLSHHDLAELTGYPRSTLSLVQSHDVWASKPLQEELDDVVDKMDGSFEPDPDERDDRWWAVCDDVCGRLVVDLVTETRTRARKMADENHNHRTCDAVLVRGEGEEPPVGERLTRGEVVKRIK